MSVLREAAVAVTAVAVTAAADISAEGISAEAEATALAACISAVAIMPVRGSPSHIHLREGAFAAVLLLVEAGGTSARSETPRCDPEATAAL